MDRSSLLAAAPFLQGRLHYFESTTSTSDVARQLVLGGVPDAVVVAESQTAGRGRLGRPFRSPPGEGLYLTMALPPLSGQTLPPTIVFACAAAKALSGLAGKQVGFKWVNDLLLDGRKIAGILAEGVGGCVIVGVGVNVNNPPGQFLPDLPHVSSLYGLCGRRFSLEEVASRLIASVDETWLAPGEDLYGYYRDNLVTLGKAVRVTDGSRERTGRSLSLGPDGALLVLFDDTGKAERVVAGDVSVRGIGSYLP